MSKYQLPDGNTILSDADYIATHHPDAVLVQDVVQTEAKVWQAFEFYRKFTMSERIAARALAQTDPIAHDFLHTLDNAIASGANVRPDDPDTVNGMAYLSANPVGSPVLAAGRAEEILA